MTCDEFRRDVQDPEELLPLDPDDHLWHFDRCPACQQFLEVESDHNSAVRTALARLVARSVRLEKEAETKRRN